MATVRVPSLPRIDDLGSRGQRHGRPVAGRVVVAQAADDRAHLAHDRIGHDARHVVEQAPAAARQSRSALDRAVTRNRAEGHRAVDRRM